MHSLCNKLLIYISLIIYISISNSTYAYDDMWTEEETSYTSFTPLPPTLINLNTLQRLSEESGLRYQLDHKGHCSNIKLYSEARNPKYKTIKIQIFSIENISGKSKKDFSIPLDIDICPKNNRQASAYFIGFTYDKISGERKSSYYPYKPPFSKQQRHLISQSFIGNPKLYWLKKSQAAEPYKKITTHSDPSNYYAIDIVMPEGTDICAARGGILVEKKDNRKKGIWNKITKSANYAKIQHEDSSFALYAHLKHKTITKQIGDYIKENECFAKSGDTGNSSGPHLHFSIMRTYKEHEYAIPFKLYKNNQLIDPVYMNWLTW